MKKVAVLISVLSLVVVLFTACTHKSGSVNSNTDQNQQSQNNADEESMIIAKSFKIKSEENIREKNTNNSKTDSGRYQGQADNNFIEIKISGVPDDKAIKVFMLSEKVKAEFEKLKLKKDENVKFDYFQNDNEQLVITKIEKIGLEGDVKNNSDEDFTIQTLNGSIGLMNWDDKVDIKKILGDPISEDIEVLGEGADTFKGSTLRKLKYNGLELTLMSPKDNGNTFFVLNIRITGDKYSTWRNIQIGDEVQKLLKQYPEHQFIEGNKSNGRLKFENADLSKNIIFTIKKGIVHLIEYNYLLQ